MQTEFEGERVRQQWIGCMSCPTAMDGQLWERDIERERERGRRGSSDMKRMMKVSTPTICLTTSWAANPTNRINDNNKNNHNDEDDHDYDDDADDNEVKFGCTRTVPNDAQVRVSEWVSVGAEWWEGVWEVQSLRVVYLVSVWLFWAPHQCLNRCSIVRLNEVEQRMGVLTELCWVEVEREGATMNEEYVA